MGMLVSIVIVMGVSWTKEMAIETGNGKSVGRFVINELLSILAEYQRGI